MSAFPPLAAELERLLSLQERFERLRRDTLLRKGQALCDLAYASSYDGPDPAVLTAIREALDSERALDLQYTPYGGATITRRLVAQQLSGRYGLGFHYRDVILTPGAMAALNILFRAVRADGPDGGEVVVVAPCWMDYPLYLVQLGLRPVLVPVDSRSLRLDLDRLRAALGPATRAIVLSQPANPTGIVYSREELGALAALLRAQGRPPLLVSDECHREICGAGVTVTSPVELYDETCVVYSFGKSLLAQGQRIGYIAVSPRISGGRAVAEHLERICRMMGFCTPTALMQLAVRRLLDRTPSQLAAISAIERRRAWAVTALRGAGYELVPPEATFFLYPRSPDPDDFELAARLAERGVLVLPSTLFHHPGHFRISLTATDEMLDRALRVLGAAAGRAVA
jgi:aspartate aminotransferase